MFPIDATTLSGRLQDCLQKVEALESFWTSIVADALNESYADIISRLSARGFTPIQISQWDRGQEYQIDIGLFFCLTKGGATQENVSPDRFKVVDRREELCKVVFTIGGLETFPLLDGFNVIAVGPMTRNSLDTFGATPQDIQW